MINPNSTYNETAIIDSIQAFPSVTIYKMKVKGKILDYTVFNKLDNSLKTGMTLRVNIGYSIILNEYFIKSVEHTLKIA